MGRQGVRDVWSRSYTQNTDAKTNVTSQVETKLLIGNINVIMVVNVSIQAINQPMKLDNIACARFNTEVSTEKLRRFHDMESMDHTIDIIVS